MQKIFTLLLINLLFTTCAMAHNGTLHLAKDSKTSYVIALANDAIPAEKTAAEQFQKYFQQVTGAAISIAAEKDVAADAPQILIGAGTRTKVLLPQQDWESLGNDGIVIKTVGQNLILAGGRPRGTLYAVFQFLEDVAGCRWWTPTESTIPHKSTFNVPAQNVVYVPPFSYREHYAVSVRENPEFATIMRENGHHQRQKEAWGGHYNLLGFVHTFSKLIPVEKYFQDHPEWYSDPNNGHKPATADSKMPGAQATDPCLGNPEVLEEVTKNALKWIQENPNAGYISISQNDNGAGYCRDPYAEQLIEKEGSPAAPLLDFVNKVAARIHQQYPDFLVETLAYHYSEIPPKTIRPAQNVIVRLAPISSDFGHPLNSDWNADTRQKVKDWSAISPQLFVWNYVTNFRGNILPHPNWLGLDDDLRFFADNKVIGIFEQGDSYTNGVGDFVQLRDWLLGHLMWNPNLDQEKLTDEFLQGYYGAASPYLKQYLDLIQQSFLSKNIKLSTFNDDFSFLTLDVVNQSIRLFQQAADAVKDDKVLSQRVRRERLSLDIATLYRYNILKQTAAREGKKFLGPQDPNIAMTQFIETAKAYGLRNWTEGGSFEKKIPYLEGMFAPPVPLPEFAKQYPAENVVDIQQHDYSLHAEGRLSFLETDAAASNGKAASIVGTTNAWAIQARLGKFLDASPVKWHVYAMARVDTKAGEPQTGSGLAGGIYDVTNRKYVGQVAIPIKEVAGSTYQRIDLGVHQLSGGMYIWFAPTQNPAVEKVYVDRIILIREP